MKLFTITMLIAASFILTSCESPAANTANAKPANNANTAATAKVDTAADEAAVRKMIGDVATGLAKNDADAMEKIYGDGYTLVNLDGSIQTRAERLAAIRSGDVKYETFAWDETSVRVNPEGNGAVAISRANLKGTFKGAPLASPIRVTQVFAKTKDGWRQVSAHASPITATGAPAKTADKTATAAPANANAAAKP
jgi:ketosteroid isomerase-like protein